ncbi:DNA-binding protein [Bacillus sp. FJAT-27225]|uniref:DNA-binding protein n=1 Tax=Bacillus sp. FJAT-27225 TaxID=1743144 RepID=UPI00080C24C5|nr:DNA-binding protein [Bacillus sp. FJAT-27225]OCA84193.1 DNA-binding protein [Bacillus sp. FJAT-27225]
MTVSDDFPKIPKPAERALIGAGYTKLEQFTSISEADILNLHGVGPKAVMILKEALAEKDLKFAKEDG